MAIDDPRRNLSATGINYLSALWYHHVLTSGDDLSFPHNQRAAFQDPRWTTRPQRRVLESHDFRLLRRLGSPKIPQRIIHCVQRLPLRLLVVCLRFRLTFRSFATLRLPFGPFGSLLLLLSQFIGRKLRCSRPAESLASAVRPNNGPNQRELVALAAHRGR